MIKLKDILFEIEIGKDFLTDPDSKVLGPKAKEAYKRFLASIGRHVEPNTEDEEKILTAIADFIYGSESRLRWISYHVDDIIPLKDKYPAILDPRSDKGKFGNKLYRAMGVPYDTIHKAIEQAGGVKKDSDPNAMITIPYNGTVSIVVENRKVHSLTYDYDIALKHLVKYRDHNDFAKSVRVIAETDADLINDKLLMAPSFLDVWDWNEHETWYVGKEPMKCTALHIRQSTLSQIP